MKSQFFSAAPLLTLEVAPGISGLGEALLETAPLSNNDRIYKHQAAVLHHRPRTPAVISC